MVNGSWLMAQGLRYAFPEAFPTQRSVGQEKKINGSCWTTSANYLTQTAADFVAVHETTILAESVPDTEQAARNKGWKAALTPCNLTKAEGKSAGTAVCCRTHIGARKSFDDDCCSKWVRARLLMKHLGAVCKGGVHFGSCCLKCNW